MRQPFSIRPVKFSQVESNSVRDCDSNVIQDLNVITMPKNKSQKGTVAVHTIKGRLRLIWSFCGKRYFFALELQDSKSEIALHL